jgi:hypothetical protein
MANHHSGKRKALIETFLHAYTSNLRPDIVLKNALKENYVEKSKPNQSAMMFSKQSIQKAAARVVFIQIQRLCQELIDIQWIYGIACR